MLGELGCHRELASFKCHNFRGRHFLHLFVGVLTLGNCRLVLVVDLYLLLGALLGVSERFRLVIDHINGRQAFLEAWGEWQF